MLATDTGPAGKVQAAPKAGEKWTWRETQIEGDRHRTEGETGHIEIPSENEMSIEK